MTTRLNTLHFAGGNTVTAFGTCDKCWTQIGGVWVDETADVNSATTADVPMGGAVGDEFYIGMLEPWFGYSVDTSTAPTGTVIHEYWNGSAWAAYGSTQLLTDNSTVGAVPPSDWVPVQVNGEPTAHYYIKCRRTTAGTGGTLSAVECARALRPANARSITIADMASPRRVHNAIIRLFIAGSGIVALERLFVLARFGSTAYAPILANWTTTNNFTHGESWSHVVDIDVTALADAEWASGNTHTFDVMTGWCYRGVAPTFSHVASCELILTYEQDDTAARQTKTIFLPFDSFTGSITTTQTILGSAGDWPNMSTFLPEANPSIDDAYVRFVYNSNEGGTTDYTLYGQIDNDPEEAVLTFDASQDSDTYFEALWRPTGVSPTSAHDLKARMSSNTGSNAQQFGALLAVTYTHDAPSNGDTVLRQLVIPHELAIAYGGGTAAADATYMDLTLTIPDAAASLQRAGAVVMTMQSADPGNLLFAFGAQTPRSYLVSPSTVVGPVPFVQRWDAGGVAGSGISSFATGNVTLTMSMRYDSTPTLGGGCSMMHYVLYRCTHASAARSQSVLLPLAAATPSTDWTSGLRRSVSFQWELPESDPCILYAGMTIIDNGGDPYSTAVVRIRRGDGEGYETFGGMLTGIDANTGVRMSSFNICGRIKKYTGQPADQWTWDPVSGALTGTIDTPNDRIACAVAWVTYHDYHKTVSGNITGSNGGTIDLALHRASDGKLLKTANRTGDGSYSFTWYNGTDQVYVVAREDATHLGRSDNGTAV